MTAGRGDPEVLMAGGEVTAVGGEADKQGVEGEGGGTGERLSQVMVTLR